MGWRSVAGKRVRLGIPVVALAALAAGCDLGEPPTVLEVGHVDGFEVEVEDGELVVHVHDDEAGVERDPAETVLHARPGSKAQVPNDPRFAFLGPAGSDVWILPQVQNPNLLWLGWNTENIAAGTLQGNQLDWSLRAVDGPGALHLYQASLGNPIVLFDSDNGLPDVTTVSAGTHAHANWAFTAAGEYSVTFEATARLADGTPVSSGLVDYTFTVERYECGDVDDVTLAPETASGGEDIQVGYTLANCGTQSHTYGVDVSVTAPGACGGATESFTAGPHALSAGASVLGATGFEADTCAGDYTVKVKASGVAHSYAAEATLSVN